MTLRYYHVRIKNKPFIFLFSLLLPVLLLGGSTGCDRSDQGAAVPSSMYQDELFQANARIQELSAENERIRIENELLKESMGQGSSRDKESADRIRKLIEGYGPGIWDQGENNTYPRIYQKREGQGCSGNDSGKPACLASDTKKETAQLRSLVWIMKTAWLNKWVPAAPYRTSRR